MHCPHCRQFFAAVRSAAARCVVCGGLLLAAVSHHPHVEPGRAPPLTPPTMTVITSTAASPTGMRTGIQWYVPPRVG